MNPDVSAYIANSERWPDEMAALRPILLDTGLDEQIKWRSPCYSHNGKNVAILQEFNDFLALMFFKGALLDDPESILEAQGPNSRAARRIPFTSVDDVTRLAETLPGYLREAIRVEEASLELEPAPDPALAEELQSRLDQDPALQAAFHSLTPGRQREYNLHISSAKQSKTRAARVDKLTPKILARKGLRDR